MDLRQEFEKVEFYGLQRKLFTFRFEKHTTGMERLIFSEFIAVL